MVVWGWASDKTLFHSTDPVVIHKGETVHIPLTKFSNS